jgi:hypothetical protein
VVGGCRDTAAAEDGRRLFWRAAEAGRDQGVRQVAHGGGSLNRGAMAGGWRNLEAECSVFPSFHLWPLTGSKWDILPGYRPARCLVEEGGWQADRQTLSLKKKKKRQRESSIRSGFVLNSGHTEIRSADFDCSTTYRIHTIGRELEK